MVHVFEVEQNVDELCLIPNSQIVLRQFLNHRYIYIGEPRPKNFSLHLLLNIFCNFMLFRMSKTLPDSVEQEMERPAQQEEAENIMAQKRGGRHKISGFYSNW